MDVSYVNQSSFPQIYRRMFHCFFLVGFFTCELCCVLSVRSPVYVNLLMFDISLLLFVCSAAVFCPL